MRYSKKILTALGINIINKKLKNFYSIIMQLYGKIIIVNIIRMSLPNFRRLMNEISKLESSHDEDSTMFSVERVNDNMFNWEAIIIAPKDSLYEGYKFKLDIQLPSDYPTSPMKVKFVTPIAHVNISTDGDICINILKQEWSSALSIRTVLISLIALLSDPNPIDPFNPELVELYRTDKKAYVNKIKKYCAKHAIPHTY